MKAFSAAVISAVVASAAAAPLSESQYQYLFTTFVDKYEKSYETNTFMVKYNTFKDNLNLIMSHNEKNSSYTLGMNQFGDMTQEEFKKQMNMELELSNLVFGSSNVPSSSESLTDLGLANKDWSASINNPVKNQGSCGSCWAFSTIGSMEYRHAKANGLSSAKRFSEQQLVDCDTGNSACNGGLMSKAFSYINNAGGVCLEGRYPYTGKKESCKSSCIDRTTKPRSSVRVSGGEAGLVKEIGNGPVTVAVAASASAFQFYKSGILDDSSCGTGINHAVLAVGYGTEGGKDYIKIRNSWGAGWGDRGYIRFAYNKNICGLGTSVNTGYDYAPVY